MIGIIGAMDQEVKAILGILNETELTEKYGIKFWKGKINEIECIVAQSGVGKVNAARCTQLLIEIFHPSSIINIGSAGALNPELEIGDVVISSSCIQHDCDITAFGHPKGYITGIGDRYIKSDKNLMDICSRVMEQTLTKEYKIMIGPISSGDQFINDPVKKEHLWDEFKAYCDDMEAAAIAQVCYLCAVPYIVVRSISDKPKKESEIDFYKFLELASYRCACFIDNLTKFLDNQKIEI